MIRLTVVFCAAAGMISAHDIITTKITYSKEISRLIYKRCVSCHVHQEGEFSLLTYDSARPWAKSIKEEADARRMPPWQAIKGFAEFKDDRGLTQEEIELIDDWVEGGAPEGNPKHLPDPPKPGNWLDGAVPKGSSEVDVASQSKLDAAARVVAIRAKDLKKGASVQVVAARPDGTIEPLLWIYDYNPQFARTYYYVAPVSLPAGTEIEMSPADAGSFALYASAPKKKSSSTGGAR
jgi:hypothetical protein